MINIEIIYKGSPFTIQTEQNKTFNEVIQHFLQKSQANPENLYFLTNGFTVNPENKISNLMSTENKNQSKMVVLANTTDDTERTATSIIQSKCVICPQCLEPCRIELNNYKIKLYDCINAHTTNNMKLVNYKTSQLIDLKKIVCDVCKTKNLFDSYQNQFFKCINCDKNLCTLCRTIHDKTHGIISYEQKNYICKKHNEYYMQYCIKCKINICFMCENEHKDHEKMFYSKIMPNYNEILEKNKTLKNSILIFKKNIQEIKNKLDDIADNMQICEEINTNILENFETKNRNFEDLQNLNSINDNILNMTEELNNINNIDNESIKLNNMLDIYKKMMGDTIMKSSTIIDIHESLSKEQLRPIIDQMENSLCEIYITYRKRGTGFIIEIPNGDKDMYVLITSNQLIGEEIIKKKDTIRLCTNNGKDEKKIKLNDKRKIYTNEISDITIIELIDEDDIYYSLDLDDALTQLFPKKQKKKNDDNNQEKNENMKDNKIEDENYKNDLLNTRYNNESLYILNYPEKKKLQCHMVLSLKQIMKN